MKQHEILKVIERLNERYTELENWYLDTQEISTAKTLDTLTRLRELREEAHQLVKQLL